MTYRQCNHPFVVNSFHYPAEQQGCQVGAHLEFLRQVASIYPRYHLSREPSLFISVNDRWSSSIISHFRRNGLHVTRVVSVSTPLSHFQTKYIILHAPLCELKPLIDWYTKYSKGWVSWHHIQKLSTIHRSLIHNDSFSSDVKLPKLLVVDLRLSLIPFHHCSFVCSMAYVSHWSIFTIQAWIIRTHNDTNPFGQNPHKRVHGISSYPYRRLISLMVHPLWMARAS